jgi:hypothetical protein
MDFFSGNPVPIAVPKKFAVSVEELLGRQQNTSMICMFLVYFRYIKSVIPYLII